MKKIVILNGSNSPKANTAAMVLAFAEGARAADNEVNEFMVAHMNIHGCLGCMKCMTKAKDDLHICVQVDDMEKIYPAVMDADVLVFASPMYWWGITGQLKLAVDRLEAIVGHAGLEYLSRKSTVLLMTFKGGGVQAALNWYAVFSQIAGCRDLGTVIGFEKQKIAQARQLGASIH